MKRIILPGLTTTPASDWKGKIAEIEKFGLKEIALFPTWLKIDERKELYEMLEKTSLEKIPHIHLRDDTEEWEFEYYEKRWKSFLFNIHINEETEKLIHYPKYKDKIFIETTDHIDDFFVESLDHCGGLCLDISHWEDKTYNSNFQGYEKIPELIRKYGVGCSHISVMSERIYEFVHYITGQRIPYSSFHYLENMSQLDYVKKYVGYLPEYVSIELENSFEEQLKAKEYLEKIINGK